MVTDKSRVLYLLSCILKEFTGENNTALITIRFTLKVIGNIVGLQFELGHCLEMIGILINSCVTLGNVINPHITLQRPRISFSIWQYYSLPVVWQLGAT